VLRHGASRKQIARTLNAAYGDGLLSQETFASRLDQVLRARLIDPAGLIGDLSFRGPGGWRMRVAAAVTAVTRTVAAGSGSQPPDSGMLLALDWSGAQAELIVGRHHDCDVVLSNPSVSRRHARLVFRDGNWIIQDLESTNGTEVNGVRVGRCSLRPGDRLILGGEYLRID
jgi:hypothetical protein